MLAPLFGEENPVVANSIHIGPIMNKMKNCLVSTECFDFVQAAKCYVNHFKITFFNCKTRRESFKFCDLVCLILEILQ